MIDTLKFLESVRNQMGDVATWVSAFIALCSFVFLIYEHKKKKEIQTNNESLQSSNTTLQIQMENIQKPLGFGWIANEQKFFNSLDLVNASEIKVFAHTGQILITELLPKLISNEKIDRSSPLKLKVLLKDPKSEHASRKDKILTVCDLLLTSLQDRDDINLDIRFYTGLQTFRGVFVKNIPEEEKNSFASAYHWVTQASKNNTTSAKVTKAVNNGLTRNVKYEGEPDYISVAENWFDYYWGPGIIHTLIFDFDDTLLNTFNDHINAWTQAITETTKKFVNVRAELKPELLNILEDKKKLEEHFMEKFIIFDNADLIASDVLDMEKVTEAPLNYLKKRRSEIRKHAIINNDTRTSIDCRKINNVSNSLDMLLRGGFTLYVGSLTDEDIISESLKALKINSKFSGILGRSIYSERRKHQSVIKNVISDKAFLIQKICSLSGVPQERVIYIGDHRNDYLAAIQADVSFIEARLIEEKSHLFGVEKIENHKYFTNYQHLSNMVDSIQSNLNSTFKSDLKDMINRMKAKRPDEQALN